MKSGYCDAYLLICELARANGVERYETLPGCWEYSLDECWTFAVNGHRALVKHAGINVPAGLCAILYRGFLAGWITPSEIHLHGQGHGATVELSASIIRISFPRAALMPALNAAALPKLRRKRTPETCASSSASSEIVAHDSSVDPSSMNTISNSIEC